MGTGGELSVKDEVKTEELSVKEMLWMLRDRGWTYSRLKKALGVEQTRVFRLSKGARAYHDEWVAVDRLLGEEMGR